MTGTFLIFLYFFLGFVAIYVVLQPERFIVKRSAVINAPPKKVFSLINDLKKWKDWSPWAEGDATAQILYTKNTVGYDAQIKWSHSKKAGAGSMTLVNSNPYKEIRFNLDLIRPFKSANEVIFSLSPAENSGGAKTLVVWSITGRDTFISKFFNLLISRDKMIGKQFEEGLANLDLAAQKEPRFRWPFYKKN
jgi:Polyketide cyclase / dehydrase and lipid transport